jgi:hypothetical protein
MIKGKEWGPQLERIRQNRYLSIVDICDEIGISFRTWKKIVSPEEYVIQFVISRKIESYLEDQVDQ